MRKSLKKVGLTGVAVIVMMGLTTPAIAHQDESLYDTAEGSGDYASQSLLSCVENTATRILNVAEDSGI